jgi:FkbM family methyltransferase
VPNCFPSKPITMDSYTFQLHGIASHDTYWEGVHNDFEPEFQRLCRRLVMPDYVCFDIGANIGVKTLYLSRHCREGRVIAVEAGRIVAECLATNIIANDAHNAISLHAAVAGHIGSLTFDEASAWGHLAAGSEGAQVEAVTLETIVAGHELTRLDFIKIDIEGGRVSRSKKLARSDKSI